MKSIRTTKPENKAARRNGLMNVGNTCYFNACVQCLTDVLRSELLLAPPSSNDGHVTVNLRVACKALEQSEQQLETHYSNKRRGNKGGGNTVGKAYNPTSLLNALRNISGQFNGQQQQDSHEAFVTLVNALQDEELASRKKAQQAVQNLKPMTDLKTMAERVFGGELVSVVRCKACHRKSHTPSSILSGCSLEIPKTRSRNLRPRAEGQPLAISEPARLNQLQQKEIREKRLEKKRAKQNKRHFEVNQREMRLSAFFASSDSESADDEDGEQDDDDNTPVEMIDEIEPENSTVDDDNLRAVSKMMISEKMQDLGLEEGKPRYVSPPLALDEEREENDVSDGEWLLVGRGGKKGVQEQYRGGEWQEPDNSIAPCLLADDPSMCSLQDCLTAFTRVEELAVRHKCGYECATCKTNCDATKRMLFTEVGMPRVMVFHLKRLSQRSKDSTHVHFPAILDMLPYMLTRKSPRRQRGVVPSQPTRQYLYQLAGVVVHSGGSHGGHYTSLIRQGNESWIHASDTKVKTVKWDDVAQSQAYMLFYVAL